MSSADNPRYNNRTHTIVQAVFVTLYDCLRFALHNTHTCKFYYAFKTESGITSDLKKNVAK